jgi:hypothetical protein
LYDNTERQSSRKLDNFLVVPQSWCLYFEIMYPMLLNVVMRIDVNLVSPILDTPEYFWSEPSLEVGFIRKVFNDI